MRKNAGLFALAFLVCGVLAFAAPPKHAKPHVAKPSAKIVDVWHCPVTGDLIKNHKTAIAGPVVGAYRVHFCCGMCSPQFSKLNAKDKAAKVAAAHKKDLAAPAKAKG